MPNWVLAKINASNGVINALKNNEGEIDFNTVLPRPAIFEEFGEFIAFISESDLNSFIEHLNAKDKENGLEPLSERLAKTPIQELAKVASQAREYIECEAVTFVDKVLILDNAKDLALHTYCKLITGSSDPLDWSTDHWGTKWNASEVIIDDKYLEMQTAWGFPFPVIYELSKKFPDETISVDYADEDLGYNCGSFAVKNGEVISEYLNTDNVDYEVSRRFARELWGFDPDDEEEDDDE